MFGCYRRGDANDPDRYVAAVTAVLARYEPEVIRIVTDPNEGIPGRKRNGFGGMPDVADVKEACEAEANRRLRLQELGAAKRSTAPRLPKPQTRGMRANALVRKESPQYAAVVAMTNGADELDWCWDAEGRGIWVSRLWLDKVPMKFSGRSSPPQRTSEAAE